MQFAASHHVVEQGWRPGYQFKIVGQQARFQGMIDGQHIEIAYAAHAQHRLRRDTDHGDTLAEVSGVCLASKRRKIRRGKVCLQWAKRPGTPFPAMARPVTASHPVAGLQPCSPWCAVWG